MLTPRLLSKLQATFFQYYLEKSLAADGAADIMEKEIQSGYHFWSELLNIGFPTIDTVDAAPADVGVNQIVAQFKSGANQVGLSNDFIDLALMAAPGRLATLNVSSDPSSPLHITGFPWPYLYEASGSIIADVRNNSGEAQTLKLLWTGFLIPKSVCPTPEDFYRIIADENPDFGGPQ